MSAVQVQIAILVIVKMAKIFGCCILIAAAATLTVMAILKQCFGISTKKLVYKFLNFR